MRGYGFFLGILASKVNLKAKEPGKPKLLV
jgi:hypothetical protein